MKYKMVLHEEIALCEAAMRVPKRDFFQVFRVSTRENTAIPISDTVSTILRDYTRK